MDAVWIYWLRCATLIRLLRFRKISGRQHSISGFIAYSSTERRVFYTANNIAYSAPTALITRNSKEWVEMGSYRFIFAFSVQPADSVRYD